MEYTEKEKKAITILDEFELRRKTVNYNRITVEDSQCAKTVLNLLGKQQKEIERLQNKDKEYIKIENNNLEWQKKYNELKKATENSRQFKVYMSGMRSGKELLNKYINDSIPKDNIREKIKDLRYNESLGFEQSFEETFKIEVLEELLGDE